MQHIQTNIHNAILALFPSSTNTAPLCLLSSSTIQLGDESARLSLIYQENEHFNSSFENIEDAFEQQSLITNNLIPAILTAINQSNPKLYAPLTEYIGNGLISLSFNSNQDSLFIQITDQTIYITFTQSGQY